MLMPCNDTLIITHLTQLNVIFLDDCLLCCLWNVPWGVCPHTSYAFYRRELHSRYVLDWLVRTVIFLLSCYILIKPFYLSSFYVILYPIKMQSSKKQYTTDLSHRFSDSVELQVRQYCSIALIWVFKGEDFLSQINSLNYLVQWNEWL